LEIRQVWVEEAIAVVDDHPRGHKNLLLRNRLDESS
jgi:hypothetical protein